MSASDTLAQSGVCKGLGIRALIVIAAIASCHVLGERIPVSGGLGYDGVRYAAWARDFYDSVFVRGIPRYYTGRILPVVIVHYGLRACRASMSNISIVHGFVFMNIVLLIGGVLGWNRIAEALHISTRGYWIGAATLFGNYAVLKGTAYYPTLTDIPGFVLGIWMLVAYLEHRAAMLLLLTLVGAFTWPTAPYVGAILLLWPGRNRTMSSKFAARSFALVIALGVTVGLCWIRMSGYSCPGVAPVWGGWVPVSISICAGYVFLSFQAMLRAMSLGTLKSGFAGLKSSAAIVLPIMLLSTHLLQCQLGHARPGYDLQDYLKVLAFLGIAKPGIFLISHIVFLGPGVLLIALLWKRVCELMARSGPAIIMIAALALIMSLDSESRHLFNLFPLVLPFGIQALDERHWQARKHWGLVCLCLLGSKIWLPINSLGAPMHSDRLQVRPDLFPDQRYFMSIGPWMSDSMFCLQGIIVVMAGIWLWRALSASRYASRNNSLQVRGSQVNTTLDVAA